MDRTRAIVQKLMRLTIETGTCTGIQPFFAILCHKPLSPLRSRPTSAAFAIVNIILVNLPGEPPYYQANAALLSKMYANTMMVLINSRMQLSSGDSHDFGWTDRKTEFPRNFTNGGQRNRSVLQFADIRTMESHQQITEENVNFQPLDN